MSQFETLKARLDESHTWPEDYLFKFIVVEHHLEQVQSLFKGHSVQVKSSSSGRYQAVTAKLKMKSSDEVVSVYQKASQIEGVIAL